MGKALELKGVVFGRLTVIELFGSNKHNSLQWLCKCSCGKEKVILGESLKSGNTQSCGCFGSETKRKNRIKHGESHKSRIYGIWSGMRNRCNCKNRVTYKYYGGRGISVCKEWNDFPAFKNWALSNGYLDNLTLDRIDSNGNYEPDNCRWITIQDQQLNRRKRGTCC